ncbi:hypothetical protein E4L96_19925 [Massilia arenosa]|uniref:Uncharacterized protein n=1 Tax=Zemynaea arenosa TaxID=2561931 RepID=A0A4Y9S1D8_9BURK|nr:hypothetical protein [Massilia arenosa]TFW13368.1 hypothetical protein E4L96_19925 [Massilia arenosa]
MYTPLHGVEYDEDILAGLDWLAVTSGNRREFWDRLKHAQEAYIAATGDPERLGQDPSIAELGVDQVASYLAQSKSLLDNRRSWDPALAPKTVPLIKQLGLNVTGLDRVSGSGTRARRMLRERGTYPESALFELVMAGNYSAMGVDTMFIDEMPGQSKTPDLRLVVGPEEILNVELKRLRPGLYDQRERIYERSIYQHAAELIYSLRLSLHLDVTYLCEVSEVPPTYLQNWLTRALSETSLTQEYVWHDRYGAGKIKSANLAAVHDDVQDSSLYFGTKMARLLTGSIVNEYRYHLIADATPDWRDPRYVSAIRFATVVTWRCNSTEAIQRKARHLKARLVEADRQVAGGQPAILHFAMDVDLDDPAADLRRERNQQVIRDFISNSHLSALYVHYLVPRTCERHTWLIDETVDRFGPGHVPVPVIPIFSNSEPLGSEVPAWRQPI